MGGDHKEKKKKQKKKEPSDLQVPGHISGTTGPSSMPDGGMFSVISPRRIYPCRSNVSATLLVLLFLVPFLFFSFLVAADSHNLHQQEGTVQSVWDSRDIYSSILVYVMSRADPAPFS